MKIGIFSFLLFFNTALGACQFKRGVDIIKTEKGYEYSSECHTEVGKILKAKKLREEQVSELSKSIQLKDLAIDRHQKRAVLWQNTAFKLEDRIHTMSKFKSFSNWIYFGLGIITAGGAVYLGTKVTR